MSEDKKRKRLDEILEIRVPIGVGRADEGDDLDRMLKEEEKNLIREAKRKQLEDILLDRELRIAEKKRKLKALVGGEEEDLAPIIERGRNRQGAGLASLLLAAGGDPKKVAEFLKHLTPEEVMKLSLLLNSAQGAGSMNSLVALMLADRLSGRSEGTSTKELAEAVKTVVGTAKDLGAVREKREEESSLTTTLLDKLFDVLSQLNEERLKRIEEKTAVNPIQTVKDVISLAKELGLGKQTGNPELELKLKEFETRTQLALEKMRQEYEDRKLQREIEKERMQALTQYLLGPALMTLPNMIEPFMRSLGKGAGQIAASGVIHHQPRAPTLTMTEQDGKFSFTCPGCGKDYSFAKEELKKMDRFICPNCGTAFQFEGVEALEEVPVEGQGEGGQPGEGGGEAHQ